MKLIGAFLLYIHFYFLFHFRRKIKLEKIKLYIGDVLKFNHTIQALYRLLLRVMRNVFRSLSVSFLFSDSFFG